MGKRAARTAIVPRVALIGPDAAVLEEWACDLRPHHLVARLGDPERAVRQVESERFEVMVVDLDFRDASAIGLLGRLRWAHPGAETIVVSEPVPADIVVAAMRLGASDFLCKPLAGPDALARHVAEAVARGKSAEPRPDSPVEMLCGAGVPASGGRPPNYMRERRRLLADFDHRYFEQLLRHTRGNLSEASRESGVDRSNLRRLLRELGLDATAFRPR